MKNREKIISIVEATVAAYSNAPVWYKTNILKYMQEYSDQQNKSLLEEIERLKTENSEMLSGIYKLRNKITHLQSELKAADSVNEQLQAKIEELKLENNNLESRIRSWDKMYKTLLQENLEFKSKLFNEREYSSRRNDDIKALEEDNQQLQSRMTELQSDIKRFKSIQSQETTRANELQDEVERLKSELKAAESGNEGLSKSKLKILNEVKFSFEIHSDFSSQCNGYKSLCKQIEHLTSLKQA